MGVRFSHEHSAGVCVLKNLFSGKILFSDCDANGHYTLHYILQGHMLLPIFMGIIHQKIKVFFLII